MVALDEEARMMDAVKSGAEGARVVYADWLEERGHVDRATFLRREGTTREIVDLLGWLHELGMLSGVLRIAPGTAMLVLSSPPLPAGTGVQMTTRPQVAPFAPTQILIPDSVAPHFVINDVKVGNRSQLKSTDPIPAEAFSPSFAASCRHPMTLEEVQTAMGFVISVTNTSALPRSFVALVFGREPRREPSEISPAQMRDIIDRMRAAEFGIED